MLLSLLHVWQARTNVCCKICLWVFNARHSYSLSTLVHSMGPLPKVHVKTITSSVAQSVIFPSVHSWRTLYFILPQEYCNYCG